MLKNKLSKLNEFCIIIIISIILIDPTNRIFKIKELALLLSCSVSLIFLFNKNKFDIKVIYLFILYFLIPNLYGTEILLYNNPQYFDINYWRTYFLGALFGLFLFNLNFIDKTKLLKYFFKILWIYSLIYMFLIINFNLNIFKINQMLYEFSLNKENFMASFQYMKNYKILTIFYKTSPILIIYYSYLLYHKNKKWIFILFILLMSGTAANVLASILVTIFFWISKLLKNLSIKVRFILFIVLSFIGMILFKSIIFSKSDIGNSIKYGHLISYIEFWGNNFNKFITGLGLGSGLYSIGRSAVVFDIELTYLEMIKLYGLPIGLGMLCIWGYPLLKLINKRSMEWLFISYLGYFLIGGTNPLLLGSTGAIVLMIVYRLVVLK